MTDTVPKSTPKKRTAGEWRPQFLAALKNSGNVRAACQSAGIDRKTAYNHRDASQEFRQKWDEAMQDAIDVLEAEARKRAMAVSDVLLIFLLKAHRPEKYRDTYRHEVSGPDGRPMQHEIKHEFDYDGYAQDFAASLVVAEAERIVSGSDGTDE